MSISSTTPPGGWSATHVAEDVTQATFIVLVKKADRIDPRYLAGWLVNTTRLVAKRGAALADAPQPPRASRRRAAQRSVAD